MSGLEKFLTVAVVLGLAYVLYQKYASTTLVADNTGGDVPPQAGNATQGTLGGGTQGNPTPDGNAPGGLGETG